MKTGLNEAFVIDSATRAALIAEDERSAELIKPLIGGEDIRRYYTRHRDQWLIFTRRGTDIDLYPAIRKHLLKWRADLSPKTSEEDKVGRKPGKYRWHEIQDDVAYFEAFERPKIIFPDIAKEPRFDLSVDGSYLTNTGYAIGMDDQYLLAILNSRVFWFAISHISIPFGVRAGRFRYRLIYQYMAKVPVRAISEDNPDDLQKRSRATTLVDCMLSLHKRLSAEQVPQRREQIEREIAATDRQIDALVYQLYGLSDAEIRIVEEATA